MNSKIIQHNTYPSDFSINEVTLIKWTRGVVNKLGEIIGKECSQCKKCFLVKRFRKDVTSPNGYSKVCEICSMSFLSPCCGSVIEEKIVQTTKEKTCECGNKKYNKEIKTQIFSCSECKKIIE